MKAEVTTPVVDDEIAALEKELAEAQMAHTAAESDRSAAFRKSDLLEKIALEKRKAADAAIVKDLELKHGREGKRIVVLETPDGLVVVKRPTITKFKGFQDTETKTLDVQEGLVRDCLLYPDQRAWNALVDAQPGIVMRAANAVVFLAGVRVNDNLPGK